MLASTEMITGFNTDVQHEGQIYHVQTEDGGKGNPTFESLVYVGGTIVAKKLTPYPQPFSNDASPESLASLLKRQHQIIIAAIKAGRIEDLIRHSAEQQEGRNAEENKASDRLSARRPAEAVKSGDRVDEPGRQRPVNRFSPAHAGKADVTAPTFPAAITPPKPSRPLQRTSIGTRDSASASSSRGDTAGLNLDQVLEDYVKRGSGQARLDVKVLTPEVFTAGKGIGLRVQVTQDENPHFDATVTVKIIGTAFKPQVFIGRVGRDGVASFSLTLPSFTTGTAAIVIEAQSSSGRGELKNLIRRA